MSAHLYLDAARQRAAGVMDRRPLLVGLLVLDGLGVPVELVSPFGSETAARQWAAQNEVTRFQVLPARPAAAPR
ncbi:hypothetical protein MXD62_13110 [Frankia sp. Mgl5]|uniref:hypothetical protein n=1 Tax=Frankia sp. Mgl5 TaxID=2933793 RepID=UPI00200CB7FA|nr:hypothetical protein [Frankia sp. Mgl5]MCK9928100.1 hypothetical protein [Frankia sp. Mgl5]